MFEINCQWCYLKDLHMTVNGVCSGKLGKLCGLICKKTCMTVYARQRFNLHPLENLLGNNVAILISPTPL